MKLDHHVSPLVKQFGSTTQGREVAQNQDK